MPVTRPLPEPDVPAQPQRFVLLVALPPQLHEQLEARAHRDGANMAHVARKALAAYLRPRSRGKLAGQAAVPELEP